MPKIAIIGSGMIGRQMAMIFASSPDNKVCMFDVEQSQLESASTSIKTQLASFEHQGCLRGSGTAEEQDARISTSSSLSECVEGADYIQECVPEAVELKKKVFEKLDELVSNQCICCSSSSCIVPSKFTESLKHRSQCLVAHPVNPPYHLPLVELVAAPWTDQNVLQRVKTLLESVGCVPVIIKKEVDGFAVNRLQYPIINEAWNLVQNGVMSAEDVDKVMVHGLGPRYAFYGPFAVMQMNANGVHDYLDRFKSTMLRVSGDLGSVPDFEGEVVDEIAGEMNKLYPIERLNEEYARRDAKLASLQNLKKKIEK